MKGDLEAVERRENSHSFDDNADAAFKELFAGGRYFDLRASSAGFRSKLGDAAGLRLRYRTRRCRGFGQLSCGLACCWGHRTTRKVLQPVVDLLVDLPDRATGLK